MQPKLNEGLFYYVMNNDSLVTQNNFVPPSWIIINLAEADQFYSFIAYQVSFFCTLVAHDLDIRYLLAARKLVYWLKPSEHVYSSLNSVQLLEAVTILATMTAMEPNLIEMSDRIAANLVANQNGDGTFYDETDIQSIRPGTTASIALALHSYALLA